MVVFSNALLTGLNARAFGNQILSVLWKFRYFKWHFNGNKLCYAYLMVCLMCQTIRFFHEVNDTMYYPFLPILHIFFILLVKSMLLAVVSFWYYDIVSMLQKPVNSWYESNGLSLVAMLTCMCLNLLFTFFVSNFFQSIHFCHPCYLPGHILFSTAWLTFVFCVVPGFWTAFMPHWSWHDICWLICKENCRSKDHKRMKSIYPWNPV